MRRLVLIDGHAILHRAYHALPPLTTSKGQIVNAVFGFTSMLLRVINDLKPTHLAVTFDRPKPTFRKKMYEAYQAKRPEMDKELASQIDIVHRVIEEMGIPIYELDGYEADDVIGTLAKQADKESRIRNQELGIIIVTGDRDILQLVDDKTKVYMPVKGLSESKLYGEKEVEEKYGVKPSQIVDYKALIGDQSDNYPGVPGVGPKTANSLLSRFETLERIYQHVGEVESKKLKETLLENRRSAALAKELATIITDVPITVDLGKCKLKSFDRPNVHHLLEELEFRSLIPRLALENPAEQDLAPRDKKQTLDNKKHLTDNIKYKKNNNRQTENTQQISLF